MTTTTLTLTDELVEVTVSQRTDEPDNAWRLIPRIHYDIHVTPAAAPAFTLIHTVAVYTRPMHVVDVTRAFLRDAHDLLTGDPSDGEPGIDIEGVNERGRHAIAASLAEMLTTLKSGTIPCPLLYTEEV